MHDRTRRYLCRLGFLLFCIAPTLLTCGWIGVSRSPGFRAAEKARLESLLTERIGLRASIQQISHPTRGVMLLDGFSLFDRETGAKVAWSRQLEVGRRGEELVVVAAQPEVASDQMWRLWEMLQTRVLRGQVDPHLPATLAAGEVTIHRADTGTAATWTDVHCRLTHAPEGPQATLQFRDVALQMAEPAMLRVTRNRTLSPPATRWELDTKSTPLLCSILADYVTTLASLGPAATFQGTAAATRTDAGWEGEIHGEFAKIDLDRVVTEHFPHKLSGEARLDFRRAKFRGGRIVDAAGSLRADGGVVSASLIEQAGMSLGLTAGSRFHLSDQPLWRYQQLAFDFTVGDHGLQLHGRCQTDGDGIVLADIGGPLLSSQQADAMPVVALVRALSPDSAVLVPATLETDTLLHALPIPATTSPAASQAKRRIFSPLRLR